jgi:hypothetical protein
MTTPGEIEVWFSSLIPDRIAGPVISSIALYTTMVLERWNAFLFPFEIDPTVVVMPVW